MRRFNTTIIGFGNISAGYAQDPRQLQCFKYATHAQALGDHPNFDWTCVVDPSMEARNRASTDWGVKESVSEIDDLASPSSIEVAVLATPPDARMNVIDKLPNLKAVLVEKPLGTNLREAHDFVQNCRTRGILVAVNLPRRYDHDMRQLANGGLHEKIGAPIAIFGTYGNGLRNNGTHLIDLIRMLFGDVEASALPAKHPAFTEGPISNDLNLPFSLTLGGGLVAMVQPLRFSNYREVGLDIWGERGRLQIMHESLTTIETPIRDNRQLTGAMEISHDYPKFGTSSYSDAMYHVYENLADALSKSAPLLCSGEQALVTMKVVEDIFTLHDKAI